MEDYQKLFSTISDHITLKEDEHSHIFDAFSYLEVSKNTKLEVENKPCHYLYFIIEGFIRVFYTKDGEERTTQINCPSGFITSFQSFITHSRSYENVETVTDCKLLYISKKDLDILNIRVKNWKLFAEKIYEKAVIYNEARTRDMILLNAEERYLKLLKNQPELLQNVPLQYLASYIGIKPESLSRIRRQIVI